MTAIWRPDIPTVKAAGRRQSVSECRSCVHPYGITGIEITDMQLTLVKWKMATRPDLSLCSARSADRTGWYYLNLKYL